MGDVSMLMRRLISTLVDFVMLDFSSVFHAVLQNLDNNKLLMMILSYLIRSVR